jgi:cytochrome c oxidase subunit 3
MSIYRISEFRLTQESSIALDFAIWYWHFVDVVWLFLFLTIYWGSLTNYLGY